MRSAERGMNRVWGLARRGVKTIAAGVLMWGLAGGGARAEEDVIGGSAIIPINPDFSLPPSLIDPLDGTDILSPEFNPGNNPFADAILRVTDSLSEFSITVPTALGASLAQSISAGNRPSVLTPYAGILAGSGQDAVFDSFGSLVTNKATTLGRGKFGIGLSYQHARFNSFDGDEIGDTVAQDITVQTRAEEVVPPGGDLIIADPVQQTVRIRADDIRFTADVITLALSYGLLENVDVGALIPYIFLETKGDVSIAVEQEAEFQTVIGGVTSDPFPGRTPSSSRQSNGSFDRDFDGLGDIILFTKWQLLSQYGLPGRVEAPVDMALQFEVKLSTGNEKEFLGTGQEDVALRMLMQREMTPKMRLRGELGYNYSGLGADFSSIDYKLGGEYMLNTRLAASAEVIGSYSDELHNVIDAVGGLKYSVSRDLKLYAGMRVPLNDNGLRYSASPIVGVEYTISRAPKAGLEGLEGPSFDEFDEFDTEMAPPAGAAPESGTGSDSSSGAAPEPMGMQQPAVAPAPMATPAAAGASGSSQPLQLIDAPADPWVEMPPSAVESPAPEERPLPFGDTAPAPLPLPDGRR